MNEKRNTQVPQQRNATKTSSDPPHLVPPRPLQGQDLQPLASLGLKAARQEIAGGSGQCRGGEDQGPGPGGKSFTFEFNAAS